jgi:hypothetical protein
MNKYFCPDQNSNPCSQEIRMPDGNFFTEAGVGVKHTGEISDSSSKSGCVTIQAPIDFRLLEKLVERLQYFLN